jgi:hypothetical protein
MNAVSTRLQPQRLEQPTVLPTAPVSPEPAGKAPGPAAAKAAPDGFDRIQTSPFSAPRTALAVWHPRIPRDEASVADTERRTFDSLDQKEQALEALRKDPRVYFDIRGPLAWQSDIVKEALRLTKDQILEAIREDPRNYFNVRWHFGLPYLSDPDLPLAAAGLTKAQALEAVGENSAYLSEIRKMFPSTLGSDPDILFEAARLSKFPESVLGNLPDALKQDRAWLLRMVRQNVWALNAVPASMLQDPKFLTEAAMAFPPILDDARFSGRREALLAASPELQARYSSVKQALEQLHIDDPMRLRNSALLDEVVRNRLETRAAGDTRPTAVLVYAKGDTDPRGVLNTHNIDELTKHYRVMFYEARTDQDFIDAIKDGGRAGAAELVAIDGHGRQTLLNLGETQYSGTHEELQIDLSDEEQFRAAGLEKYVQPDARIFLDACSQGAGEGAEENDANMFARLFPGREVFATTGWDPSSTFPLDKQGRVERAAWERAGVSTYRARVEPPVPSGVEHG